MKHAIIILGHKRLYYINEIIEQFHNDEDFIFFINYDNNDKSICDTDEYKKLINNDKVKCIKHNSLKWGCFNIVDCEIELLREVYKHGCDFVHLISEDSRFLYEYNIDYFKRWFETHNNAICINFNNVSGTWRTYQFNAQDNILYQGSQWFSICEEALKYIFENNDERLNNAINIFKKYFIMSDVFYAKYNVPDELFIQYIFGDLSDRFEIFDTTMFVDWKTIYDFEVSHPAVLDMEFTKELCDDEIINSNKMYAFARKYNHINKDSIEMFEYLKNNLKDRK